MASFIAINDAKKVFSFKLVNFWGKKCTFVLIIMHADKKNSFMRFVTLDLLSFRPLVF